MKLDGILSDLILNRHALKIGTYTNNRVSRFYAGGGLIRIYRELDMTNASIVSNGNTVDIGIIDFTTGDTPHLEWVVTAANLVIKGFAGGSGAVAATLGTNSSTYDDMVNTAVSQTPGGATAVRGVLVSELGSRLNSGGVKRDFLAIPGTDEVRIRIDATAHTGTVTAGIIVANIIAYPLTGFT